MKMTNFWMGRSTMDGLIIHSPCFLALRSPIWSLTLRTRPSSSWYASRTLASFHSFRGSSSSLTITISPACVFHLGVCHRCLRVMLARCSFLHLLENCSAKYCTRRQRFRAYKSSLMNSPGGGTGMEDFIVSKWLCVNGSILVGSLILLTVSGRLFTIAMDS